MAIRYEKDTLLNWVNEMGKFLRLLVDQYEAFDEPVNPSVLEEGYQRFFNVDRLWFIETKQEELFEYLDKSLDKEQIRPLALLLLRDGLLCQERQQALELFRRSKLLLNHASTSLGAFSFEDYAHLVLIDEQLLKG